MIKSVVSSLIALAVVATPVAAEARNRDNRDGNRWEHREKRSRISTGEAIAIGVGAFILGAAASRKQPAEREVDREVYDREYEYHYRRQNCREIFTSGIDRYGDYYEKRITRCN
jgi:Ni/Co efflux regulator RcnB